MIGSSIQDFSVKPFLDAADLLCQADEFERAIALLENLPGYQRDNVPIEVEEMLKDIRVGLMTSVDYQQNRHDHVIDVGRSLVMLNSFSRGKAVEQEVAHRNSLGDVPTIVDFGPGEYWLPIGLKSKGKKFRYKPISLIPELEERVRRDFLQEEFVKEVEIDTGKKFTIFLAMDVIEHLRDEYEILQNMQKYCNNAHVVFISTPLYCNGPGNKDWRAYKNKGLLGHLRTYTPREFTAVVTGMFPKYRWDFSTDNIMLFRGVRSDLFESEVV